MIIAHQEIAPDEAVLPHGVFSTNSMGLHMEDSLSMVLRNLYALYGEPISDDQISLKHNPLFRLQVVSRMPRPISHLRIPVPLTPLFRFGLTPLFRCH